MKPQHLVRPFRIPKGLALLALAAALTTINLIVVGIPFNPTSALLTDTQPVGSNTFTTAACFPNWMYVSDITFGSKTRGSGGSIHDERITVTIRQDSNVNCIAEVADATASGASLTLELRDGAGSLVGTSTGTTGVQGTYTSGWFLDLPDGTYTASVTALTHSTYNWYQALDVVNPQTHTIPH